MPTGNGRWCVFDCEGNGLLPALTKIHCIAALDVHSGEEFSWRPDELRDGIKFLNECECLIGHNILDYDFRALEKVAPIPFKRPAKYYDTLIMVRVVWPPDTLIGRDMKLRYRNILPPRCIKSHTLEAWGFRMGERKADFEGPWDEWSEEMHDYMCQDVRTNAQLWQLIKRRIGWEAEDDQVYKWPQLVWDIEFGIQEIALEQEQAGFAFDVQAARDLERDLMNHAAELERTLQETFGSWWHPLDDPEAGRFPAKDCKSNLKQFPNIRRPRYSDKTGNRLKDYVGPPKQTQWTDAPFVRIKRVTFKPSSRDHVAQRLIEQYGWTPATYGDNGKPNVDEGTIKAIPDEVLPADVKQHLLDYFVVTKTLGHLSGGKKSWLGSVGDDNRIHGRINTCGAITGRAIHSQPNMSQVPALKKDANEKVLKGIKGGFGFECRSLFTAGDGKELTGTDVSSLELALLGHYLYPLDDGQFAERMSDPERDPHAEHGELTGLNRAATKTVTYCKIFGGGAWKVGTELELEDSELEELLEYAMLPTLLRFKKEREGPDYKEPSEKDKARLAKGHKVSKAFEEKIPGFKELAKGVRKAAERRKWVKGLDGRKIYVRKPYAALSTLLQGNGAIVCKLWIVRMHQFLKDVPRDEWAQVAWSHDETQHEHIAGHRGNITLASQHAMDQVCEELALNVTLRISSTTGRTWAETH